MDKNKIVIFIPTSGLSAYLESFIQDLKSQHFTQIVLMMEEDMEAETSQTFCADEFVSLVERAPEESPLDLGLKTLKKDFPMAKAAIIADEVGRYSVKDVEIVASALATAPDELILGVRQYTEENVPSKTKWGTRVIQKVLNFLENRTIQETPTSLRALSIENLTALVTDARAEFENKENMLLDAKQLEIPLKPVPIYTNTMASEEKSFFERLMAIARMYQEFIKFTASSLFSTVVDLSLFALFVFLLRDLFPAAYIMISTIIARTVSTVVNYTINNKLVFKRKNETRGSFIRYISLAITEMLASGAIVTLIVNIIFPFETLTKIIVDSALFFVGYLIQRKFVFTSE